MALNLNNVMLGVRGPQEAGRLLRPGPGRRRRRLERRAQRLVRVPGRRRQPGHRPSQRRDGNEQGAGPDHAQLLHARREGGVRAGQGIGAEVVAEPYQPGGGAGMLLCTFADPDGNYFQLATPWEPESP
jgi:hypothetical protein